MIKRTKMIVLTGVAALALAGGGVGIAYAQGAGPPTPTPTPSAPSAPGHHGTRHGHDGHRWDRGWPGRIVHGEATVDTGNGTQVIDLQRGTVDSVSPTGLTVRSADGFTATYKVGSSTKIRKDRKASDISRVAANDRVFVLATRAGDTMTATRIDDTGPAR